MVKKSSSLKFTKYSNSLDHCFTYFSTIVATENKLPCLYLDLIFKTIINSYDYIMIMLWTFFRTFGTFYDNNKNLQRLCFQAVNQMIIFYSVISCEKKLLEDSSLTVTFEFANFTREKQNDNKILTDSINLKHSNVPNIEICSL